MDNNNNNDDKKDSLNLASSYPSDIGNKLNNNPEASIANPSSLSNSPGPLHLNSIMNLTSRLAFRLINIPTDVFLYTLLRFLTRREMTSLSGSSKSIYQLVTSIPLEKINMFNSELFRGYIAYTSRMNNVGLNHWTFTTISVPFDLIDEGFTPENLSIIHSVIGLEEKFLDRFSSLFEKSKSKIRIISYRGSSLIPLLTTLRSMEMMDIEEITFYSSGETSFENISLREWTKLKKVALENKHGALPVDFFPLSIKDISMNQNISEPIPTGFLPEGLERLNIGTRFLFNYFTVPLDSSSFPSSLIHLSLINYHHSLHLLNTSIRHLSLDIYTFNRSHPIQLPSSLISLYVGSEFDNGLEPGDLPASLEKITFSGHGPYRFSLPVGLFIGLKNISIEMEMVQPLITNVFPRSLRTVRLSKYNHPIALGVFPEGVEEIDLRHSFNHPFIPGSLPSSLKKLELGTEFRQTLNQENIPSSLKVLRLAPYLKGDLSITNISRLEFNSSDSGFFENFSIRDFLVNSKLPQRLSTLILPDRFYGHVELSLPTLTSLQFGVPTWRTEPSYNLMFDLRNTSITSLHLPKDFDIPLDEILPFLPPNLQDLNIPYSRKPNYCPDATLINMIPQSIISLKLGSFAMSR